MQDASSYYSAQLNNQWSAAQLNDNQRRLTSAVNDQHGKRDATWNNTKYICIYIEIQHTYYLPSVFLLYNWLLKQCYYCLRCCGILFLICMSSCTHPQIDRYISQEKLTRFLFNLLFGFASDWTSHWLWSDCQRHMFDTIPFRLAPA